MSIRKLLLQGGAQFNIDGNSSRSVVYRSDSQQEAAVLADPDLPALGSAHPDNPFLFVKTRAPQRAEDGTIDVVVSYSTMPYADSPPPPKQPGDQFVRWTNGTVKRKLHIPGAVKTPVRVPLPDNTSVIKRPWQPYDFDVTRTYATLTLETTVPKLSFGQTAFVAFKNDKIHTIQGKKYLFSLEFGTATNELHDVLRYQWVYDPGSIEYISQTFNGISLPDVVRPPFTRWVRIPADDAETPPIYKTFPEYDEDPTGYLGLPGVPSL